METIALPAANDAPSSTAPSTERRIGRYVVAAIALLTRKKWLEYGMFALAGIGLVIGALAALHI